MSDESIIKPSLCKINRILREVQAGSLDALKTFKSQYPNLHWCEVRYEKTSDTVLHIAARLGHTHIIKYLLSEYQPTAVNCTNHDNKTPLHEAAQFAQYDALNLLLNNDACANSLKRSDWTPLMLACTKIEGEKNFKCVELLVQKGAIINYKNKDGWTVLHLISREGDMKILYYLHEHGLNVLKTTKNGRTALHIASLHKHLKMVKALIHLGLNVNSRDNCGNTPLHEAVLGGDVYVCRHLLSDRVGADVNAVNNTGFGVLHLAASLGHIDVMKYLINELNVDINKATFANLTALHCAARKNEGLAVEFLLSKGADAYFRDNFGRCAAEYINC